MTGALTEAEMLFDGLAAFTEVEVKETTETTAKIPARAIFLSMNISPERLFRLLADYEKRPAHQLRGQFRGE